MKNLPVKLLCPGLLAAALLSAGAGFVYGYANYNDCRCNQASPYNSDSDNISNCCSDTTSSWYSGNSSKCSKSCSAITCASGKQPSGVSTYTTDSSVCCTAKTPCSTFWKTTTVGKITTFSCILDYPSNYTQNTSCSYQEDCNCCLPPNLCNADRTIASASVVCSTYGSSSTECICANGNAKQCAGAIYGASAPETVCIQNSSNGTGYCMCSNFTNYWQGARPNWQDFACIGYPAKCTSSGTN